MVKEQVHAEIEQAEPMLGGILDEISGPEDLKKLERRQLPQVCEEIRKLILKTVLDTGGHLGSNLGIVEATVALHYCYDFLWDRIVWDVSHQVYPHKILTGRRERFGTIRQTDGLSGFCNIDESPFDTFTAGHAGMAISSALGVRCGLEYAAKIAADMERKAREEEVSANGAEREAPHVVAVVGDAGLGAGAAFEGLNAAGDLNKRRFMVVLNDNEWSISKTVGALAHYLSRVRSSPLVQGATKEIHRLITSIPIIGQKIETTANQLGEVLRHLAVPGHVFEELGITYVGPIDGHSVQTLVDTIERCKKLDTVVLLHILTEKGKGYKPAIEDPERGHGVSPAPSSKEVAEKAKETVKVEKCAEGNGVIAEPRKKISFTASFAEHLCSLAEKRPEVVAITAAMPSGTGLKKFAERFPDRFFDTGITEQHAVAFSAGLCRGGAKPVVAIYSTFLQRGYDQVFQEIALQRLPVLIAMDRGGLVGQDGPTHNGIFDIAYLRVFPGMVLCSPRDDAEMRSMLEFAIEADFPIGMRYPRASTLVSGPEDVRPPIELGKAEWLQRGERIALLAYGPLCLEIQKAAAILAREGLQPTLINARFAKPLDREMLSEVTRTHDLVVTVEDHAISGGFGSACLEACSEMRGAYARIARIGVPDRFVEHMNSPAIQHAALGMDGEGIARRVLEELARG